MSEVERLCDKIIMMKKGKIIDTGSCEELIKNMVEIIWRKLFKISKE